MEECDSIALKTKGSCTFSYCARKYDILSKRQSVYLEIGTQCASFLVCREALGMGRVKREENFTSDRLNQTIISDHWHVMGLYTGEGAQVNQLLHWEFVPILNKINNILTD